MSEYSLQQQRAFGRLMVEGFKKGDAAMVKGCLEKGADPNVQVQDGDSGAWRPVLHWGAQHFDVACMRAMVEGGADLEARNGSGETALHHAARQPQQAAVKFLMQNGADPVALDSNGKTPIDAALGLRSDHDYYRNIRDSILKALATEGPAKDKKPPPRQSFNDKAAAEEESAKGITAPKTARFGQKDREAPKKGFSL